MLGLDLDAHQIVLSFLSGLLGYLFRFDRLDEEIREIEFVMLNWSTAMLYSRSLLVRISLICAETPAAG